MFIYMSPAQLFKALSDETRLRLLNLSLSYELNVNELVQILEMGQSRISHHLKILTDNALLTLRRDGQWAFYAAARDGEGFTFAESVRYLFKKDPVYQTDLEAARHLIAERSRKSSFFFNQMAQKWESLKQEILGDYDLNQKILEVLPSVNTVVDLGCGTGDLLPVLRQKAHRVIGVEKSEQMLKLARQHYSLEKSNIDIRVGELEHLPLRDGEADAALTNMVLHHLPEPKKAIQEASRILRPGGTFLIIELLPHSQENMRERFGDLWLGFSLEVIESWLRESRFRIQQIDRFALNNGFNGILFASIKNEPKKEISHE
jgi:ubiquinone/menaquinone biosynthesis C-methylase UbiE